MEKILRGVLNYRKSHRLNLLKEFQRVRDNPQPTAVFISCIDSRLFPPQFTSSRVGDMFMVRNAGNLIPHAPHHDYSSITTEPGALELGCIRNNIRDVIVCGHSDCKAMNLLYSIKDTVHDKKGTPLELWVKKHGSASVIKYGILERQPKNPLRFTAETPNKIFHALIDPEMNFKIEDRFSMVNTLQQLQNIASYPFLQSHLEKGLVHLHAMWFDIYTGDVYLFSREKERFLLIDESQFDHLLKDTEAITMLPSDDACSHQGGDDPCIDTGSGTHGHPPPPSKVA